MPRSDKRGATRGETRGDTHGGRGGAVPPGRAGRRHAVLWGTDSDVLALDLIQEFEHTHDGSDGRPAIRVVMGQTAVLGKDSDAQRLLCSVMGGDPPDVVWLGRNIVAAWASKGAFTNLQPYVERDLAERPDDRFTLKPEQFYDHCWDEAHFDGDLYAAPATTDVRVLFYNLDVLEKHADELRAIGCVDPDDPGKVGPPRTWAQLKQCVKLLTEFDEHGRLSQVGFIPNYGNAWLCLYAWLNRGEFMSQDGRTCTMDAPEIVDALVYMTELYDLMGGIEAVRAFESALPQGDMDPLMPLTIAKVSMSVSFPVARPRVVISPREPKPGLRRARREPSRRRWASTPPRIRRWSPSQKTVCHVAARRSDQKVCRSGRPHRGGHRRIPPVADIPRAARRALPCA